MLHSSRRDRSALERLRQSPRRRKCGNIFLNRIFQILVTLVFFLALSYFILDAQPGDITLQYVNPRFTEEQRLALTHRLGLDRPVTERFARWLGNALVGELGDSFELNKPVIDVIAERAPRTVFLFSTALIIEFIIGYFLGRVLAWNRGTALEYGITVFGSIMYTIFTPWFALMMLWLFSFTLKWFPLGKFLTPPSGAHYPRAHPSLPTCFLTNSCLLRPWLWWPSPSFTLSAAGFFQTRRGGSFGKGPAW